MFRVASHQVGVLNILLVITRPSLCYLFNYDLLILFA